MKRGIIALLTLIAFIFLTFTVNAASINGYWHNNDLKILISGSYATVNGHNVKLIKHGNNKWQSKIDKTSQPFKLKYVNGKLHFNSGMDNETLYR